MLTDWLHDPWIWLGAGLVLLLGELVVPGYVLLSFGFGAFGMAIGLLAWSLGPGLPSAEATGAADGLVMLVAWMLISGVALALIWRFWRGRSRGPAGPGDDVNDFSNRL